MNEGVLLRLYLFLCFFTSTIMFPRVGGYLYHPIIVFRREAVYLRVLQSSIENLIITIILSIAFSIGLLLFLKGKTRGVRAAVLLIMPVTGMLGQLTGFFASVFLLSTVMLLAYFTVETRDLFPITLGLGLLGLFSAIEIIVYKGMIYSGIFTQSLLFFWLFLKPLIPIIVLIILVFSIIKLTSFYNNKKQQNGVDRGARTPVLYLIVSVLTAIIFYAIPYTSYFNPNAKLATTDIIYYTRYLKEMNASGNPFREALTISSGDRPLYLLLLYAMMKVFGLSEITTSTISGWVWSGLLVLAVWYMVREQFGGKEAIIAGFLTGFSQQALSFIYGGFQANQFTLSLLYTTIGLLSNTGTKRVVVGSILVFLSPFFHVWAWLQLGVILVFWRGLLFLNERNKPNFLALLFPLISFLTALAIEWFFLGSIGKIANTLVPALSQSTSSGVVERISGVWYAFNIYLWGSLGIPTIMLLAPMGQYLLMKRRPDIIDSMILISVPLALFFAPNMTFLTRLLLNIPFQAYVGVLLSKMKKQDAFGLLIAVFGLSLYYVVNSVPE